MNPLKQLLERVRIGTPRTFGGLTVFPLLHKDTAGSDYQTFDQALDAGTVRLSEINEGGSVPELKLDNTGDRPIFLLDGEEVCGAKQNRVFNLTVLAPAGKTIIIPVSCVEQGRWSQESELFAAEQHVMPSVGRSQKMGQVSESLESRGTRMADQTQVWCQLRQLESAYDVSSPTSRLSDIFRAKRRDIDEYVRAFPAEKGQVGAVFAVGGRLSGAEAFCGNQLLRGLFPKLVRSWALDAMSVSDQAHDVPMAETVRDWLLEIASAPATRHDAIGLGEDVRISSERITGSALLHEKQVVHFCAFGRDELDDGRPERDASRSRGAESVMRASQRGRRPGR